MSIHLFGQMEETKNNVEKASFLLKMVQFGNTTIFDVLHVIV